VAYAGEAPILAGISVTCTDGAPTMLPVTWSGDTVTQLPLPAGWTEGTALAIATSAADVYVGGATSLDGVPIPTIWKNGVLGLADPILFLPLGYDAGVITSIAVSDLYAIAGAVLHRLATATETEALVGVIYVIDLDFKSGEARELQDWAPAPAASFGGTLAVSLDVDTVVSVGTVLDAQGQELPLYWDDLSAFPIQGSTFAETPSGAATGVVSLDLTPYTSGYVRDAQDRPTPALWGGAGFRQDLSTADPVLVVGAGEAVALDHPWAYVAGETVRQQMTRSLTAAMIPAVWSNGERQDLQGLVAPGDGPLVTQPFFGWWRRPGTPATSDPDWPYPGAFAAIGKAVPITTTGSAVVRAIAVLPPPPAP
jgi:hypothetical protein